MNIQIIFSKTLIHILRNYRAIIMCVLLPLILMLILGNAFSSSFDRSTIFKDVAVLYLDSGVLKGQPVFQHFLTAGRQNGIRFYRTEKLQHGIDRIRGNKYAAFVYNSPHGPVLYKNDQEVLQARFVETVLQSVMRRYNTLGSIAAINPELINIGGYHQAEPTLVRETALNRRRKPRALDYYGVSMLTMIILYYAFNGFYAIKREKLEHTAARLLASPVSNYEILLGNVLGTICGSMLQVIVYVVVSAFGFKVDWGSQPTVVALLLFCEVFMAVTIGIGIAFLVGNPVTAGNLINFGIPVLAFLGGNYVAIDRFGKQFLQYADLSPLRWLNRALFEVIYSNDYRSVIPAMVFSLGVGTVFLGIASRFTMKEEFLK